MDNFHEEIIVKRRGKWINSLIYVFTWIMIVLFALIAFVSFLPLMQLQFDVGNIIILVLSAGIAFFLFRYKDNLKTEYEYSFTNGEMDFAKVLGNTRRKHLLTLRIKDVEAGGMVESSAYDRYASMPGLKPMMLTLNDDAKLFFLYFIKDGKKQMLILEPDDEMIDLMRKANPRAIIVG